MPAFHIYLAQVREQFDCIATTQRAAIEQAAGWVADALGAGRFLFVFGSGHSHLLAEEVFYRAGGLARAIPMLEEDLMLHRSAVNSTAHERESGRAEALLARYPLTAGDVLVVASNSGRNAVPLEVALAARARGAHVVAITNLTQSLSWPSRHSSGRRLAEVAELVIDNAGVDGDAVVDLAGLPGRVGPTSSLTGILILNLLVVTAIETALARGVTPEIFISSNAGGDAHNAALIAAMRPFNRHL
jgi:uncharacterized phosphosugar-binding protein